MNKRELIDRLLFLGKTTNEEDKADVEETINLAHDLLDEYLQAINYMSSCTELRADCDCNKGKNGEGMDLVRGLNKAFRGLSD